MLHKYVNGILSLNFFLLSFCLHPFLAHATQQDTIHEKRISLAMRKLGHELLLSLGDCDSRILPIHKIGERYKLSFERTFGIDPGDVVNHFNEFIIKPNVAHHLLVEVEQCESKDVVHSFELSNFNVDQIACIERLLPEDCYHIYMTILEAGLLSTTSVEESTVGSDRTIPKLVFLSLLPLVLVSAIFFFMKKKTSVNGNPNLTLIGDSSFDEKGRILSFKNKKVILSNKEAELLSVLYASVNEPLQREKLLKEVWGDDGDYVGRTLDVFISKLRKKLVADPRIKILNIRGVGYSLVVDN